MNQALTLFVAGRDALGNFTGDARSSFTPLDDFATAAVSPLTLASNAFLTAVVSEFPLVGRVRATASDLFDTSGQPLRVETDTISIQSKSASKFGVATRSKLDPQAPEGGLREAGEPFDLVIKALDNDNLVDVQFEGVKNLSFLWIGQKSWSGEENDLPFGLMDCLFVRGICVLSAPAPLAGWRVTEAGGTTVFNVSDVTPDTSVTGVWAINILAVLGAPYKVLITGAPGGAMQTSPQPGDPTASVVPLRGTPTVRLTADDTLPLFAAVTDRGGNFLSDASNVDWGGTTTLVEPHLSPRTGASTVFSPAPAFAAAAGQVTAALPGLQTGTLDLEVVHGLPAGAQIHVENLPGDGRPIVGSCYPIWLSLHDADGNKTTRVTQYWKQKAAFVQTINQNGRGGWLPFFRRTSGGTYYHEPQGTEENIEGGELYRTGLDYRLFFCPLVAPDTQVQADLYFEEQFISADRVVSSPFLVTSQNIAGPVRAGPAEVLELHATSSLVDSQGIPGTWSANAFGCAPEVDACFSGPDDLVPNRFLDSCKATPPVPQTTTFPALGLFRRGSTCASTINSADDMPVTFRARWADAAGNVVRNATGTYQALDTCETCTWSLFADRAVLGGSLVAVNNRASRLRFTDESGQSAEARVAPFSAGVPKTFQPFARSIAGSGEIRVGAPFRIGAKIFDQYNNPIRPNPAYVPFPPLRIEYPAGLASASPKGTAPSLPAPNSSVPFAFMSECPVGTSCPALTPESGVIDGSYTLMRANESVSIQTTFLAGTGAVGADLLPTLLQRSALLTLVAEPGETTELTLSRTNAWGGPTASSAFSLIAGQLDRVFLWGRDAEENEFPVDVLDAGTASGVLLGAVTVNPTNKNAIDILSESTGTGSLSVRAKADAIHSALGGRSTGVVTVQPAALARFAVELLEPGTNAVALPPYAAGSAYKIRLRAVDHFGNLVPSFTGAKTLTFSSVGLTPNAEWRSIALPPAGDVTFSDGEYVSSSADVIPYAAGASQSLLVSHSTGGSLFSGSLSLPVNAGAFDHYGVVTPSLFTPDVARSQVFSVTVVLRDQAGNTISAAPPAGNVSLALVDAQTGAAAPGGLGGTTTLALNGAGTATSANLTYDAPGMWRVVATNTDTPALTTPAWASTELIMPATLAALKDYQVEFSAIGVALATAGSALPATLVARDAYGRTLLGVDAALSAQSYLVLGPNAAPNGNVATLPATYAFSGGRAASTFVFRRAENLLASAITVSDNAVPARTGTANVGVQVAPAPLLRYALSASHSARTADNDASTGQFSVTVEAFDAFGNVRAGDPNVSLEVVRVSGANNEGDLRLGGNNAPSINMASGSVTLSNLWYEVGHTVDIRLVDESISVAAQGTPARIAFTSTLKTVIGYRLVFSNTTVSAGPANLGVAIEARDDAYNTVTGVDAELNALTFTWSGAGTSPGGQAPLWGHNGTPGRLTFVNGEATVTHGLLRAETIESFALRVVDSASPPKSGDNSWPQLTVAPGNAQSFQVTGAPVPLTAGASFTLYANATDAYGNPTATSATGVACGTLAASLGAGWDAPLGQAPVLPTGQSQGTLGQYTVSGITLYKAGSNPLTFAACGLTSNIALDVIPTGASFLTVSTSNATPATIENAGPAELLCASPSSSSASTSCAQLYSFVWDSYGNPIDAGGAACTWSYTNVSGATVPAVAGASSSYSLSHTSFLDGQLRCARGARTHTVLAYGGASRLAVTHSNPTSVAAGPSNVSVSRVDVFFRKNNVELAKPDVGLVSIGFSKSNYGALSFGTGAGTLGQPALVACDFGTGGVCGATIPFNFTASTTTTPATLTLSLFGVNHDIGPFHVTPLSATALVASSAPGSVTAGTSFTTTIEARDTYNNLTNTGCSTLTASSSDASLGGPGVAARSASVNGAASQSSVGVYQTTGNILYKKGSNTISYGACGRTLNVPVTVNTAAAAVLNVAASDSHTAAHVGSSLYCPNTAGNTSAVACSLHAFLWDTHGNRIQDANASNTCNWTFTTFGAGASVPSPSSSAGQHSFSVATSDFVDGTLVCDAGSGLSQSVQVYGGVASAALTHNYAGGTLTAGNGNLVVSEVTLQTRRQGSLQAWPEGGSQAFAVTTNSPQTLGTGGATLNVPAAYNCTFSTLNGTCTTAQSLNFRQTQSGTWVSFQVKGKTMTLSGIAVSPAAAGTLVFTNPGTVTAGVPFHLGVALQDAFGSASTEGCSTTPTLTAAEVSNTTSPASSTPTLPGAAVPLVGGAFSVPLTLVNAGNAGTTVANRLGFTLANCGALSAQYDINVQANPTPTVLRLSSTNAIPATHLTGPHYCNGAIGTAAATTTCTLFAFGWDTYGNNIQGTSFSCAAWSYPVNNAGAWTAPSPTTGSGHSIALANASAHVDGTLRCTTAGASVDTQVFGRTSRTPGFSCGGWGCSAASPVATCTFNNNTGYDAASVALTPPGSGSSLDLNNCSASVAAGGTCTFSVQGVTGSASGTWNLSATPTDTTVASFANPAGVAIAGNAPNCTTTLSSSTGSWSCSSGVGVLTVTVTNPNTLQAAPLPASPTTWVSANGATVNSTTCASTNVAANGGQCTATVHQATPGQASTLRVTPSSLFSNLDVNLPTSPNCTQNLTAQVTTVAACSAQGGSKTLRVTLRNDNTINNANLGAGTPVSLSDGAISNNTCTGGASLQKSAATTCSFDVTWATTPTATSTGGATIAVQTPFSGLTLNSTQLDNRCP